MIMMLISYGWCISRVVIIPTQKQMVVLAGAGMMLVEVLLVSGIEIYSMSLLLVYIVAFRVYHSQSARSVQFLNSQIDSVSVSIMFGVITARSLLTQLSRIWGKTLQS